MSIRPKLGLVTEGSKRHYVRSTQREKKHDPVERIGSFGGRAPESKVLAFRRWMKLKDFTFEEAIDFILESFPVDVSDLAPKGIRVTDKHNRIEPPKAKKG